MMVPLPRTWTFFGPLFPMKDVDGRPLGEHAAPESARVGVEFQRRACPYEGHRRGTPMNVSALKQMTSSWAEALADIVVLRELYLREPRPAPFTHFDLWRIATFGTLVPGFLAMRPTKPLASGELPVRVSADFKVFLGTASASMWLMRRGITTPETPLELEHFLGLLEEQRLLINTTTAVVPRAPDFVEACAGPPHMFRDAFESVLGTKLPTVPSALRSIVGDVEGLFAFNRSAVRFVLGWALFQTSNLAALRRAATLPIDASLRASIEAALEACDIDLPSSPPRNGSFVKPEEELPLLRRLIALEVGAAAPSASDAGSGASPDGERRLATALTEARPGAGGLPELAKVLDDVLREEQEILRLFTDARSMLSESLHEPSGAALDSDNIDAMYAPTLRRVVEEWSGSELRVDPRGWSVERAR
jgi:hypothetical protein